MITLDLWADRVPTIAELALSAGVYSSSHGFRLAVKVVGTTAGLRGFTVDDLREWFVAGGQEFPTNPGATLGGMAAKGELREVGDEPSTYRSSKGRRVRRFVLTEAQ